MRTLTRSLVATAVAVPLLFVGTGAAFASEDGSSSNVGVDTTLSASYQHDSDRYDRDDNNDDGILGDVLDDLVGDNYDDNNNNNNDNNDNNNDDNNDDDDDGILGDLVDDLVGDDHDNDDILGDILG
jgi:hypothetical protein